MQAQKRSVDKELAGSKARDSVGTASHEAVPYPPVRAPSTIPVAPVPEGKAKEGSSKEKKDDKNKDPKLVSVQLCLSVGCTASCMECTGVMMPHGPAT